ncbi:hypothetical protein RND81_05G224500 [Saponaria officinalis]|uniref:AP2/ERF domain-containing protein n=1 Tax=Saponaria officinalis TaxID=3572 RepID=A0AAW1L282_SAPOF
MVSLRRRRLLGLCSGVQSCVVDQITMTYENVHATENDGIFSHTSNVHPTLLDDLNLPPREVDDPYEGNGAPNTIGCSQLKDDNNQSNVSIVPTQEEGVKRRKQYRRRGGEKQNAPMRGVYMKNHKWQAAIKVDKKQIHLGTLNSQQEAVHLYDRAAFMCGREPNLELSKEEKQELRKLNWDDFLTMTRTAITTKRTRRRRVRTPTAPQSAQNSDNDEGEQVMKAISPDDYVELDKSAS